MTHPLITVPVRAEGQPHTAAHQGTCFTMVVGTGTGMNAVEQLLGRDHERVEACVLTADEPVVLAQSKEMAQSANNTAASVPSPVGAYLPVGIERVIRNCDELWVAATSATPTRVSVIISRRLGVTAQEIEADA